MSNFIQKIYTPLVAVIFLMSCSKSKMGEVLPPPPPVIKESFTSFSANNIVRLQTSATIKWSSSNYSVQGSKVMYKVSLENGFFKNVNTDTMCVINDLVPSLTYKGQIIAFVANGDSSVLNFELQSYTASLVFGRTDMAQNQNLIEAYDIYSGKLLWKTKVSDYFNTNFFEPVISNDTVFVNANSGSPKLFFALSLKTGNLFYSSINGNSNATGSLTYRGGVIYTIYNTTLSAINTRTGAEIWRKFLNNGLGFNGKPFYNSTTLFCPTTTGIPGIKFKLIAMEFTTGNTKWTVDYDGEFNGTGHIENDRIYFATTEGVYCINADNGALIWKRPIDANFKNGPQLEVVNNKIIVSCSRGLGVFALDKNTGNTIWNYNNPNYLASVVSENNGMVYFNEIGSTFPYNNSLITAINTETGILIWSKPSNYMFGYFVNGRIYSRSNFISDVESRDAITGNLLLKIGNPNNYYTDNRVRFSISIDNKFYEIPPPN